MKIRNLFFFTDHEDDLPLILKSNYIVWYGSTNLTVKHLCNRNGIAFINHHEFFKLSPERIELSGFFFMSLADTAVLIPVFNRQEKLNKTILSLEKQGINFDIIIVDDGSKKKITIHEHPGEGNFVILRHNINLGIVAALNTGLCYIKKLNRYKFVARIDAGDLCVEKRLQYQRAFLLKMLIMH